MSAAPTLSFQRKTAKCDSTSKLVLWVVFRMVAKGRRAAKGARRIRAFGGGGHRDARDRDHGATCGPESTHTCGTRRRITAIVTSRIALSRRGGSPSLPHGESRTRTYLNRHDSPPLPSTQYVTLSRGLRACRWHRPVTGMRSIPIFELKSPHSPRGSRGGLRTKQAPGRTEGKTAKDRRDLLSEGDATLTTGSYTEPRRRGSAEESGSHDLQCTCGWLEHSTRTAMLTSEHN